MSVKVWANILSQPSRTILYVLKKLKIEYEYTHIRIPQDTRSEEYRNNVNPGGTVPVVEHDGFKLCESASAVRYLIDTFKPDHSLLPKNDLRARARIEGMLDRNGNTFRPNIGGAFRTLVVLPNFFGGPQPTPEVVTEWMDKLNTSFAELNAKLEHHSFL